MAESTISSENSGEDGDQIGQWSWLSAARDIYTKLWIGSSQPSVQETTISDPFSGLTEDQLVVLYTLFLLIDNHDGVVLDDGVTIGGIDVKRTLSELERGPGRRIVYFDKHRNTISRLDNSLMNDYDSWRIYANRDTDSVHFKINRSTDLVRSYMENCLLSDIDRDFYLQVASDHSLDLYTNEYILRSTCTEQSGDIPITFMRLLMEERAQAFLGNNQYVSVFFTAKKFPNFIQEWCRLRKLDPMAWADKISYQEAVRFLSAYTILDKFEEGFTELVFDHRKWAILISVLMSKNYSISVNALWEEKLRTIHGTFSSLRESNQDMCTTEAGEFIKDLVYNDKLLTMNGDVSSGIVEFVSDDDYKNYLNLSSADSLLEYVRTWRYYPDKNERCLYLPERMEELFIRGLGIDTILHVMVEEREDRRIGMKLRYRKKSYERIRKRVSELLKVPREILEWDYASRSRYAECVKKGTQTIHRARAMIVGCAGAGKSTLLKRLQKRTLEELKRTQSTVGLEVHEDIFEITRESDGLKDATVDTDEEGKQLLSILDFGGQCAYYACHQVYLSRRAFYILVIDMSKAFDEKVDPSICEQEGTMFMDWSYGEYMLFWLKSVHTYCDDDAPVIIVGTHLDQTKGQDSYMLYNNILDYLKDDKHLKTHLDRKRCFALGFKSDGSFFKDTLSEFEKCIVSIAKEDRWKETIPTDWALSEVVLRELRGKKMRMTSVAELSRNCFGDNRKKYAQMNDILKFLHDIGVLLHFDESSLAKIVIIDIQWFVDSFKNIITDPNHVRDIVDNNRDWLSFYKSGYILDSLLTTIWNRQHFEMNHSEKSHEINPFERRHELNPWEKRYEMIPREGIRETNPGERNHRIDRWEGSHGMNRGERKQSKTNLLQYMQRLGLIVVGTHTHYIPCMNKMSFGIKEENFFQSNHSKTSVLVYRFQFLPYFFYFRLIVACMTKANGEWSVLKDNELCLYKNVACFVYKRHIVALAVNRYAIQLQVVQASQDLIAKDVTLEIRDDIERLLNCLTSNFHQKVIYTVGYQCSKQEVFREHDDCFIEETEIYGKGEITCPEHGMINHHILSESALLGYWKKDVKVTVSESGDAGSKNYSLIRRVASYLVDFIISRVRSLIGRDDFMDIDECATLSGSELKKLNFKTFDKLTKTGRDALQIYFDKIFPTLDLASVLVNQIQSLQHGQYKFNPDQCSLLFPADRSMPSSAAFDVTIMYKLLRNYGPNLPPPTNGWGKKPDIGQRLPTDDVERIRLYRNEVEHKTEATSVMEKDDFELKWKDLSQAIIRLSNGSLKKDIMALKQQSQRT